MLMLYKMCLVKSSLKETSIHGIVFHLLVHYL